MLTLHHYPWTIALTVVQDEEDEVPKQWLPPYAGHVAAAAGPAAREPSAGRHAARGAPPAGPGLGSRPLLAPGAGQRPLEEDVRIGLKPDPRGLGQALSRGGERGTLGCAQHVLTSLFKTLFWNIFQQLCASPVGGRRMLGCTTLTW